MNDYEAAVRRLRQRMLTLLSVRYGLMAATAWCFAWGLAVIALRAAMDVDRLPLTWGAAGVGAAAIFGFAMALRRMPEARGLRAAVDRHNAAGGMVMAAEETDMTAWTGRLHAPGVPTLRWRSGVTCGVFAAAAAFVLLTFAVPDGLVALNRSTSMDVSRETQQLQQQIETLAQEKILKPEAEQELKDKLRQVRDEARGDDPVKTWAALDRLENNLSNTAQKAAQEAIAATERVAEAEAMAKTLEQAGASLDGKTLADAMNDLAEMVNKAMNAGDLPPGALDASTMEKIAQAMAGLPAGAEGMQNLPPLDAETLKKIAEACKNGKMNQQAMIARLVEAKLVDAKLAKACENAGEAEVADLVAWIKENGGDCDNAKLAAMVAAACNKPGQGAPTRGRGDAPMTWQDPTADDGAKFKSQALPPTSLAALKDSKLMGVSVGDPTAKPGAEPVQAGALAGAEAGGGSAHTHIILPRHRGAVDRYFDRETQD